MADKISFQSEFITSKENLEDAKQVLVSDWDSMSVADQDTWKANKQFEKDTDGYSTFMDYYMRTFAASNSNVTRFSAVSLGAGTGSDYTNRASRTWSAS